MPITFGAHNFYDLNSGPILAPSNNPFVNTYYKHGIAKCQNALNHEIGVSLTLNDL